MLRSTLALWWIYIEQAQLAADYATMVLRRGRRS